MGEMVHDESRSEVEGFPPERFNVMPLFLIRQVSPVEVKIQISFNNYHKSLTCKHKGRTK